MACQLSREQTPADGAPQGAEPAHSTAKIPYTTQRDAIQQEGQFASAVDSLAEALSYVSADALRDRVSRAVGKAFQSA